VRTDALKKMNLMSDRYDIESEMLIEAAEQDMIIRSVPIRTIYGEEGSQINKIRDTLRFFSLIIKYKIRQYELRRKKKKMVDEQLIPRGISRPDVLDAFSKVPRHFFVPDSARHASYEDHPLQIGEGQTISQPYIVALMTQLLPQGISRVLEVGTGSGYQAAILSEIYPEVHTVERKASLQEKAREILGNAGYGNIEFHTGDGTMGVNEAAPFGGIIVTAAAPSVPEPLIEQLKDGGSIVIPIGSLYSQVLTVVTKNAKDLSYEEICGCMFVPLIGKEGWKEQK
jgi:protein-L-isoaspartate(D-aspartate) O-methyltransferase